MVDTNLTIGKTDELGAALMTVIGANALGHFKANTVLAQLVMRDWEARPVAKGATIRIPRRGALTVNDKSEHEKITLQQPVLGNFDVTLNKHKEVSFVIEDVARALTDGDYLSGYTADAMKVMSEQVDGDIAALYSGLSQTIDASGAAGPLDDADFIEARRLLNAAKAPLSDRCAVLHEDADAEFAAIEEAINRTYSERPDGLPMAQSAAYRTRYKGFDVYLDQKVAVAAAVCKNLYFHKLAMCLATRPLPEAPAWMGVLQRTIDEDGVGLRVTLSYDHDLLGPKCTVDMLYGIAEVMDAFGVVVSTTEK